MSSTSGSAKIPGDRRQFHIFEECVSFNERREKLEKGNI
ncbi:hypothetical protein CULT_2000001 [[Clostridium] ultunense Esp]|nr:hypothetical protein CULT_2000001 [[Clostridium] ultunense Esp]